MDIRQIKQAVLDVYKECDIKTLPLLCTDVLNHYQLKLYSYGQLKQKSTELYKMCITLSKDAFTYSNFIAYNENMPRERIRFSLMHELGHLLLQSDIEEDANQFASNLLAPRIIIKQSGLTGTKDVAALFDISKEAATYTLKDADHPPDREDLAILEHFYHPELQIYVYHTTECPICGSTIYNSIKNTCLQCKKLSIKSR